MLNKSLSRDTEGQRIEAGVSEQRTHGAHILLELVNTDNIYIYDSRSYMSVYMLLN